jgi:ubiquinone/menaquinone biosynthesis C-methylase UbiE
MSDFDARAREWDTNPMHLERSKAIASTLKKMIHLNTSMSALEYGAGTALLSFLLKDEFGHITLMDNSREMIQVCAEKVEYHKTSHIVPLFHDLEHADFEGKFDVIYNQMVLHHVTEVNILLGKFYSLLNTGGYLAIADLFPEDGSFHGPEVNVHLGFSPENLAQTLTEIGFKNIEYQSCFEIVRDSGKKYPVFLLTAQK